MSTEPFRVGVIGCGFFAENHLAAWASMDEVRLAAVCDLDEGKAAAAARKYSVPACYADAAAMLAAERLDFIDIVTTMESHADLVGLAAERRLPMVVQKPLAPDWASCVGIVETCRAAGMPMMVHENTRFTRPIRMAREVIGTGALGRPTWARVSFRTGHDIYGKQPYLATVENFVILDLGVHMLDVARFLLGDVSRLYCQTESIKPGIRGEDMATIMLRHESGATSLVECSYASPIHPDPFPQLLLQVEGSEGSLRIDPGYTMTLFGNGATKQISVAPPLHPWSTPPWHGTQDSVLQTQRHWIASLRNGTTPETDGADSLKTYELVFAAYRSAREARAITLSETSSDRTGA